MGICKKGKNYFIDYYFNGRRKREKVGTSKKLAETVLEKRKLQIAEGKFLDIRREQKVKLVDFIKEYLDFSGTNKRPKTHTLDQLATRNFLKLYDSLFLNEITSLHLERYKNARLEEVSASTVNRELDTFKNMFAMAEKWGYLLKNPAQHVRKFKQPPGRLRYLSEDEIKKLLNECKTDYLRTILILGLNTGMRKGEILKLGWSDLDFDNRLIHIYEAKNNERRDIPMNNFVFETLSSYRAKQPLSDDKIFPYLDVKKSFRGACTKAAIKDFRFHDLRHTFASHLVMGGVDLATVKELMGHKSIEMTLRYAHLSPDHRVNAVKVLESRWTLFEPLKNEEVKLAVGF